MEFCCFNPFSWPRVLARPESWPYPNGEFDPVEGHDFYRAQVDQLILAEECGFDWIGVGEDHMTAYGLTPNPSLVLAIVAHRTHRVKIAIMGLPLPLLNPIRAAEETAMLDVISGGRLVVGMIRGVPQNYAAYNVEPNESRGRFDEASQLMMKAWTETETFAWDGTYYKFPAVSIWPRPLQHPHPPVIYSANSIESGVAGAKRRGRIGTIHLYNRNALEQVKAVIAAYKHQAHADGWDPEPSQFLVGFETCIADTDEEARRLFAPAIAYRYNVLSGTFNQQKRELARGKPGYGLSPTEENPPTLEERIAHGLVLCGSPETVVEQIAYHRDNLGIGVVALQLQVGNLPDDVVRRGMQLFHDRVLPRFR